MSSFLFKQTSSLLLPHSTRCVNSVRHQTQKKTKNLTPRIKCCPQIYALCVFVFFYYVKKANKAFCNRQQYNYFLSLFKSCHMLCMLTICLSRVSTCGQGGVIKLHLPLPAPAEGCGTPTTATWPSSRTRADAASSRPSPTGRLSSRLRGSGRAWAPSSAPRFRTETALWYM